MIQRAALKDLDSWYSSSSRKPLVLRGARQVGKSTLVKAFAQSKNIKLWEINLEKYKSLDLVFSSFDVKRILQEIALTINANDIGKVSGILFLDEIQEAPSAIAALRYFYEELPELHIIAAGSLLEFTFSQEAFSMPVGRIEYLWLGPITFDEYLLGQKDFMALEFLDNYKIGQDFPLTLHKQMLLRLREFLIIGGMPEAVQRFIDTGNFLDAVKVHSLILETYRDDFSKYAKSADFEKIRRVFEVLPKVIGKKVKFKQFHPVWKAHDIRKVLELLQYAGICFQVTHSDGNGLALGAEENPTVIKEYFLDVGLSGTVNGNAVINLEEFLREDFINEGVLAEQFCAQELAAFYIPSQKFKLHYWLREGKSSNAELDFLMPLQKSVLAVEVKSGTSGTLRSLHQFMYFHTNAKAVRLDLNMPSVQKIATQIMSPDGKKEINYELVNLPMYFAGRLPSLLN